MHIKIKNRKNKEFNAEIKTVSKFILKKLSKDWKFNWYKLCQTESKLFQLSFENEIQGLMKLEVENESYYVLKNIEVAPSNFGSQGRFKNIAELLMSFACLKSFEFNKGNYRGYLVFTSKGALIEYYQNKYQAELIFRERMLINPQTGKMLILKNLKIDLYNE